MWFSISCQHSGFRPEHHRGCYLTGWFAGQPFQHSGFRLEHHCGRMIVTAVMAWAD